MQLLNYLPSTSDLVLPDAIANKAIDLLLEPFESKADALAFWSDGSTQLLIMTTANDLKVIQQTLDPSIKQQIYDACNNPEFTEPLPNDYVLSLTIHSSDGNGLYVIRPSALTFQAN